MMDRGIGLQAAQNRHVDRVGLADAGEIVAHEIDDHDILGPVLVRGEKLGGKPCILVQIGGAADRALDGAGFYGPLRREL